MTGARRSWTSIVFARVDVIAGISVGIIPSIGRARVLLPGRAAARDLLLRVVVTNADELDVAVASLRVACSEAEGDQRAEVRGEGPERTHAVKPIRGI
jgi:hypothetical protein